MSDKICVNLCTPTDETPARPTKRIRPEIPAPKVLSLVDSDDDSPSVVSERRDQAVQAAERHPRMAGPWGAIEDQQVAPRSMVDRALTFRPPSARYRRLPVAQQPQINTNPSPIVIEDDDDESNAQTSLFRLLSSSTRQHGPGEGAANNHLVSSALPSRAAAAAAAPGLVLNGDGSLVPRPQPQQLQQQGAQQQYQQRQGQDEPGSQRRLSLLLLQQQPLEQRLQRPSVLVARPLRRLPRPGTYSDEANGSNPTSFQQQQQQQPPSHPQQQQSGQQGLPQQGADAGDQEDEDLRLAARLQAEEDERLARETVRRLEHEEHRRMMGLLSRGQAAATAATAAAAVEAAMAGPIGGSGSAAAPDAGRTGAGAGSSEAAAAALAARWSRLDMLETLESANMAAAEAVMARRALAMSERSRRNDRMERFFGVGGGGGPVRDQDLRDMASQRGMGLPRPGRAPGAGSLSNLLGGGAEDAALDAAAAAGEAQSAAAAAAAEAGIGRARWSSRSLHDLIPAMMAMPMPLGFHRFLGGRGDSDDGPGAQQHASRRARHAAYREHVTAMREQLVAAQRAGIPPHLLLSDRDFTPEDYELLCRLDERVENRKGAKEEQLAALPTETVGAEGRRGSDGCPATCTICMEEVAPGDVLKRLPCLHEFHGDCVDTWLKTKACCPICQRGLDA